MNTYRFDIESGTSLSHEVLDAADHAAVVRQAVLLLSEILRDHALAARGDIEVRIRVRDRAGRTIWDGASSVYDLAPPPAG